MIREGEMRLELDRNGHTILERWGDAGPNILCVHGLTSSRKGWTRLANRLFLANRVYAYDQRGHGDSAGVTGPMTLEQSVRDLQRVAGAIPGGIDTLVGHSWGGAVALVGALRIKPRRVVAIDPMLRVPPGTFFREYVDDLRPLLELQGAQREARVMDDYANYDPLDRDGKIHALAHMTIEPVERIGSENGVDDGKWDLSETVADFPVPLFVAVAGVDSVMSPSDVRFLRERGGPNVTIKTYEGQGHSLHRSAFDEFARDLEAFM